MTLEDYLVDASRRRQQASIPDNDATTDALRNRGGQRTESKKALLCAAARRARAVGIDPITSYVDGTLV